MTTEKKSLEITIPDSPDWADRISEKAFMNAIQYGSCTQSILSAFLEEFKIEYPLLIRAAGALHIAFRKSKEAEKCLYRMKNGAGEIARFLQEMNQKCEIFRIAG
jgi:hypothetical protein